MEFNMKKATAEHRDGILAIIQHHYIKNEPMESISDVSWDLRRFIWEEIVDACIEAGHSHVAVDAKNTVVGIRLSKILAEEEFGKASNLGKATLARVTQVLQEKWNSMDKPREATKKILYFLAGKGIAQSMCTENMAMARSLGADTCVVTSTNYKSQGLFAKMKFRCVAEMAYSDYKNADGSPQFPNMDPAQKCVKLYVKKLE